jgi:hypothetical protein
MLHPKITIDMKAYARRSPIDNWRFYYFSLCENSHIHVHWPLKHGASLGCGGTRRQPKTWVWEYVWVSSLGLSITAIAVIYDGGWKRKSLCVDSENPWGSTILTWIIGNRCWWRRRANSGSRQYGDFLSAVLDRQILQFIRETVMTWYTT